MTSLVGVKDPDADYVAYHNPTHRNPFFALDAEPGQAGIENSLMGNRDPVIVTVESKSLAMIILRPRGSG